MKILKSLTTAAAILLMAGCAGSGSEDDTMPVPVHERETERVAAEVNPAAETPADAETVQEAPGARADEEHTAKKPTPTTVAAEATGTVPDTEEEQTATESENVATEQKTAAEAVREPVTETPAESAAEKVEESAPEETSETPSEATAETVSATPAETASEVTSESASAPAAENASAKEADKAGINEQKLRSCKGSWYAGVEGGLAFAESSFSSFGAGGSHAGGSGSLFAGYRFNGWLSFEVFAGLGGARMTARECCSEANLWLSNDGEQFRAAVLGKDGGYYSELESAVLWQNYGLRLNFDILALIPATKDGKWSLELSPAISALGPKAKIRTMAAKTPVFNAGNWQFGAGGRIQAGYTVLPWMRAGLFTGLTFGTGRHIDALPADDHRNNFIWESGVRLTFSVPDKNCKKSGR